MSVLSVRSISMTDAFIYANKEDVAKLLNDQRRQETLKDLGDLLETRKAQLVEEEKQKEPNMARVMKLRSIINNLQGTLKTAQR